MPTKICTWPNAFVEHDQEDAHLSETLRKEVLESVVKRGAYFAHHENVLIAMINDDNMTIRELGFRRILKAR